MQYYRSGNVLWVIRRMIELAIPAIILFSGFSARLRKGAQFLGRKRFFVIAVYFLLYGALEFVLAFPLAQYAGYFRQHAYGLSNQTFAKWLGDSLTMLAVGVVCGCLLLWIPYLLLLRSPRRWWVYTGLLAVPVVFFFLLIQPIWIAPLLNHFGPMHDKPLEARILALADRAGIEGSRVFEVDKSVDTKAVNAYVTGFLSSKRIVLWDTLLKRLDNDEVLFVTAHEMGHYVLNHVIKGILASCAGIFLALYVVHRLAGAMLNRYRRRFGFQQLSDVASLPLMVFGPRGGLDGPAGGHGLQSLSRTRGGPLRAGADPKQSGSGHGVRQIAGRESRQPTPRSAFHFLARKPSHQCRADRVCQHVSAMDKGRTMPLRAFFPWTSVRAVGRFRRAALNDATEAVPFCDSRLSAVALGRCGRSC